MKVERLLRQLNEIEDKSQGVMINVLRDNNLYIRPSNHKTTMTVSGMIRLLKKRNSQHSCYAKGMQILSVEY
jgi:hypothetical protein